MARFYVRDCFEIPARSIFVLAGSIAEGEVRPGMFVHVPLNAQSSIVVPIQSIESARRDMGEDLCLCISAQSDEFELLQALRIADETLEVSTSAQRSSNAV